MTADETAGMYLQITAPWHLQAIDEAAERTACASGRSRVAPYPVALAQGLVWLWGAAGPEEFIHSAATPLPVAPEADDPAWSIRLCASRLHSHCNLSMTILAALRGIQCLHVDRRCAIARPA